MFRISFAIFLTWLVSAQAFAQVINEIHFHPACAVNYTPCPDAPIEFIELYNPTSLPIDLSGLHFIDGIEFEFGDDDTSGAGAYLVLADDAQGFAAHFGFAPFAQWAGKLSNKGETITLADANGIRDRVRYEDGSNTPGEFSVRADGEGPSLQLTDASADNERSTPRDFERRGRFSVHLSHV